MRFSLKTLKADWSFIVLATLVFVIGLLVALWDFGQLQKWVWRFGLLNGVGLALFVGGTLLRQMGKRALGKYYSYGLRIVEGQKLIQHGVYKRVRHPITLAALIYSPAIPLVFSSVYGFLVMLGMVPLFMYRIGIEEKMLIEKFGTEYTQYMKRTKRLIPFVY